jgi:hypothetical protein
VDESELVTTPASSDSVIAVGAYVTKTIWDISGGGQCNYIPSPTMNDIAPFSSPGPLRDGGLKPEISAPGMGIASTFSTDAQNPTFTQSCARTPTNKHVISQGTSQACPHITGTVALMLQVDPNMSNKEAVNRITTTARQDGFTGVGFSNDFGWGKVDAKEAVDLITPVRLLAISAGWEDGRAVIRWALSETEPGARFLVERGPGPDGPFTGKSEYLEGNDVFAWADPDPLETEPWYRVIALTRNGDRERFGPVRLEPLAARVQVWQNAPNPFSSATVITFELDRPREVTLDVIDVTGRLVRSQNLGLRPEGRDEVEWDGTDKSGNTAAAGIYFYRIRTEGSVFVRRMVLAR